MAPSLPASSSFRNRLRIQTQQHHAPSNSWDMPPPPLPHASAAIRPATSMTPLSPTASRPPLSPRGYSAAAATGQSRFVEGSMNDRVSAAPPPGFLGTGDETRFGLVGGDNGGSGIGGGDGGVGNAGGGWERQAELHLQQQQQRHRLRRPKSSAAAVALAGGANGNGGVSGNGNAWGRPSGVGEREQQRGGAVVTKKSSFLSSLWDGMKEKVYLRGSKSSGSIGRIMGSAVAVERKEETARERMEESEPMQESERVEIPVPAVPQPTPSTAGYPSREEVMESYKNLVASGFFEAHAIRGGRHPLRTGGNAPAQGPPATRSSTGQSFADHMASVQQQQHHQQQQQLKQAPVFSSPKRGTMGPPPPPPRASSQGKSDTVPSPQRGTKRGASIDLAGDAEMVTRKLVKKLRHSASRISMELTGSREHYNYGTIQSRPSTSSNAPGPLFPTSSAFSAVNSPPPAMDPAATTDDTASIRLGKLTKTKDGRRRRILGLTRRHRSPALPPATSAIDADPDAMMLDEPEHQQQQQQPSMPQAFLSSPVRIHEPKAPVRILTPPPASFRSRTRTSNSIISMYQQHQHQQHEPLRIVPDPNEGIPFVPRIPREFCDAMDAMVPAAAAVVVMGSSGGGGGGGAKPVMVDGEGKVEAKRDSGLGEDVENIPVWG